MSRPGAGAPALCTVGTPKRTTSLQGRPPRSNPDRAPQPPTTRAGEPVGLRDPAFSLARGGGDAPVDTRVSDGVVTGVYPRNWSTPAGSLHPRNGLVAVETLIEVFACTSSAERTGCRGQTPDEVDLELGLAQLLARALLQRPDEHKRLTEKPWFFRAFLCERGTGLEPATLSLGNREPVRHIRLNQALRRPRYRLVRQCARQWPLSLGP